MTLPFFEANISVADLQADATWAIKVDQLHVLRAPQSHIKLQKRDAYPNTFLHQDGQTFLLGYADPETVALIKRTGAKVTHKHLLSDLEREFLVVMLDTQQGTVRVMRDAVCTMPLFVYMDQQQLVLSNEYTSLMSHLPDLKVSPELALNHLLSLDIPQQKIIEGTFFLDQVEQLHYDATTREVAEAPLTEFAALPDYDDRAPLLFKQMIEEQFDTFWQKRLQGQSLGFELSGGLDSSMVAGYYATQGLTDIQTYTIGFYDTDLDKQLQKIHPFIKRFKVKNQLMPITLPRHRMLSRYCPPGQLDTFVDRDMYQEATDDFTDMLAEHSVKVLVTGHGGNEIYAIHKSEDAPTYRKPLSEHIRRLNMPTGMSDWARSAFADHLLGDVARRKPYIPASIAHMNVSIGNAYIRKGIWPVSPYVSPKLVYFMRHMPVKYLYKRRIAQVYLAARGFPPEIYNRTSNESYAPFLEHNIRHELDAVWKECLSKSVLIRQGYVSPEGAAHNYAARKSTLFYGLWAYKFMELEKFLQQPGINLEPV
jgi:hypothetical protein